MFKCTYKCLRYIIGGNGISGTVSTELGLLTNLEQIWLGKCGCRVDLCLEEHGWNLSSTSTFAFFPFLHNALILGDNQLSGSIPSELGNLINVELIFLCKYGCRVDLWLKKPGWNPSSTSNFAFFPLLHDALILGGNNLSGSIPSELFALPNVNIYVRKWIW